MPIDYAKYPPEWSREIVPRILARAGGRCEKCGIPNGFAVTSVPLRVCDGGRYKVKRFWITDPGDLARMIPFAQGGEIKPVRVVLTVAHLDHDETNHDVPDDRLMAMCQYCHLNYDASEKYRRACMKGEQLPLMQQSSENTSP
jgi:glyoxylase-like metal-dependent hydrolase (beta-lactamase superfamily II)